MWCHRNVYVMPADVWHEGIFELSSKGGEMLPAAVCISDAGMRRHPSSKAGVVNLQKARGAPGTLLMR